MITADRIKSLILRVEGVGLIDDFSINKFGLLTGRIAVNIGKEASGLEWTVEIAPNYPFKAMGVEPIQFLNTSLMDYPHIMQRGNLCMHPAEYEDAESQFLHDLEQLKEWVEKYYIKEDRDEHYEHLIVNHYPIQNVYYTYCFADTQEDFAAGDYGQVQYTPLLKGIKNEKLVENYVIQKFVSYQQIKKKENPCKISQSYQKLPSFLGIFCLLNDIPSVHNKFIIEDFASIKHLFSQNQKNYIYRFVQSKWDKRNCFPLFCGYRIPDGGIYWQAMMLFMDDLPLYPVRLGTGKNRIWFTDFKSSPIKWAETEDISYRYFFGRGAMPEELANKKILIMGIGAIGSVLAETLTRCGAKHITLYDIDNKEHGNVCRSAYSFFTGITEKTSDLAGLLTQISPHLECNSLKTDVDFSVKLYASCHEDKSDLAQPFDEYDIVFDCTTDNQLMRVIDATGTKAQVINLSITNHAEVLICAFSPKVTDTVMLVYSLLNRDTKTDMYNPTGCWNPTFKASYNDISCKVQFAVNHIIKMLSKQEPLNSFYITETNMNLTLHRL